MTGNSNKTPVEPIDFTALLADYSKKWVVLSFDEKEVLKSGSTYEEIIDYSDKGIVMPVHDYSTPVIP
jgi:hypothetical protein